MPGSLRTSCLCLVVTVRIAAGQAGDVHFTNPACHLAFAYPAGWEITSDTTGSDTPCRFQLRPHNWQELVVESDSVDVYSIELRAYAKSVWALANEAGFEHRDSGWVALGRHDLVTPADTVTGPGWRGLRGTPTSGCYRLNGPYSGLCDTPAAVVGTGQWAVTLLAGPRAEDVFDRLLATLRVEP